MRPLSRVMLASARFALGLAGSACGGGGNAKLAATDVAGVGADHITKEQFDDLLKRAQATYKSQGRPFPRAGTTDYQGVKNQAMQYLVQRAEYEQKADSLGVKVDEKKIDARLKQIKQQYFGGEAKKYQAALKKNGLTETDVRLDIQQRINACQTPQEKERAKREAAPDLERLRSKSAGYDSLARELESQLPQREETDELTKARNYLSFQEEVQNSLTHGTPNP